MSHVVQAVIVFAVLLGLAGAVAHEWRAAMTGWWRLRGETPSAATITVRILAWPAAAAPADSWLFPTAPDPAAEGWQIAA